MTLPETLMTLTIPRPWGNATYSVTIDEIQLPTDALPLNQLLVTLRDGEEEHDIDLIWRLLEDDYQLCGVPDIGSWHSPPVTQHADPLDAINELIRIAAIWLDCSETDLDPLQGHLQEHFFLTAHEILS